ncbi:MAG: glutamyl-tRNA reductase, partial [Gammaproteobacteria bacterium]|nr:glutamyl-tRNA reductase [Gammaproteobacteria bacterium]
ENMHNRKQAALQAEEIIEAQVVNFMEWLNSLDAVDTIRALRLQANMIQDEVLRNAMRKLENGGDPAAILQEVAHTLTNKLIHTPSSQLRNAGVTGRIDLLSATHELFDLKERDRTKK